MFEKENFPFNIQEEFLPQNYFHLFKV